MLRPVWCWGMVPAANLIVMLTFLVSCSGVRAADGTQALPPIECPLSKAGIDKTKLKPFEEVADYIKFLERSDRAEWQKPKAVVEALEFKGTETVVDLGCGSGYFTFRLSKAVPQGKVIAIDNQPEMVRHIHRKVLTGEWPNIRAQVGKSDDPGLPSDADCVFVCDVLLHVREKQEWLKTLHSEMQRGAKLVLIDFRKGELPEGPPEAIKVHKQEILRLCKEAGFVLKQDKPGLLPYQEFLVFLKP
ncbi:hypothetical protein CA13_50450 [Planctomycetes bacterium CA13]|uniref:Methyltransferase domain-containing protein n=1 Tax=Novipirellula herctigrandis TaxID=2527986 RepID=A0A5C5Z8M5_9BACT|nr:hypothetical protein CA13_50450 [Planctomycetes bacterium CA13]